MRIMPRNLPGVRRIGNGRRILSVDFDNYAVQCIRDDGKESFAIVFANLAQGKIVRTIFFDTEEELRDELKRMGLTNVRVTELIQHARQHADQQAA